MNCPTRDPEPTGTLLALQTLLSPADSSLSGNPTFNQNPPTFDRTLVPRSSPVCGGGSLSEDQYNMGLHVMAVFVVLTQSTLACAFPLIAKRFPRLRIPPSFLFFARHFGTGVLIATAFVHLLPTAFISLTDKCLPAFWTEQYPAMAGAIAMAAVFLVTIVEMVFTKGLCGGHYSPDDHRNATLESGHSAAAVAAAGKEKDVGEDEEAVEEGEEEEGGRGRREGGDERSSDSGSEHIGGRGGMGRLGFGMAGRRRSRSHSMAQELQKFSSEMQRNRQSNSIAMVLEKADHLQSGDSTPIESKFPSSPTTSEHNHKIKLTPQQRHKKAMLQVFLLEMGILFHSVFIGMALSVTVGSPFIVLLIAIAFHQTFEGLALGSRIAALKWEKGAIQPWAMACAYGLTTPIGQAIGLATHTLYSPDSPTGLLMVGIMNSISSGLLVFAGLVELLAEDFLSDESWHTLQGRNRIAACCWVFAGAFGMSLVGAWA
ncbi:Zinc/iron permease [Tricharina praecox]|uniref:Zinc/iron permease n=1 Tax=Tricharina praecox TaxID=43433 RepID=UPI00221FD4D9|nr:Zinc/iron permease [Tricharina praecox]KAI5858770.1 Zinc/iron permease [Tricharina praecox]